MAVGSLVHFPFSQRPDAVHGAPEAGDPVLSLSAQGIVVVAVDALELVLGRGWLAQAVVGHLHPVISAVIAVV
jgi:hypothetical protein